MRPFPRSRPVSLDRMATWLGWTDTRRRASGGRTARAQELLDAIESRERETGLVILDRRRRRHRTTLRITEHALREHLPWLFEGERVRLGAEGAFRVMVRNIDAKLDEREQRLTRRIDEVAHDGQVTREMVTDLTQRVCRIIDIDV